MARSRTTERRKERQKIQRRRQLTFGAIAVAVVVVLLVLFVVLTNQPADAPIPEGSAARYEGLAQSVSDDGFPQLGSRNAPLAVSWYCNFDSPDCITFHDEFIDPIVEMVRAGDISLTYVPLYGQIGNSQGAANAAVCAARQDAFWVLQDAFFNWRQQYGEIQAFSNNRISSAIDKLNINRADYNGCLSSGTPGETLVRANNNARGSVNFTTTPAVSVNGVIQVDADGVQLTTAGPILDAIRQAIAQRPASTEEAETTREASRGPLLAATAVPSATPASTEAVTAEPTESIAATEAATAEATAE
jgi:hypothetical protein